MNWIDLTTESQIAQLKEYSFIKPQVIFKHSTRCSISSVALNRFAKQKPGTSAFDYFLVDVIANRTISNKIAEEFSVYHESPQVLLIKNGECIYDESHYAITPGELTEQVNL